MSAKVRNFTVLILLAITSLAVFGVNHSAMAESSSLILTYKDKVFHFSDNYIQPTNHLVEEEIYERKINAPLEDKLNLVERILNMGADSEKAVLHCFPLMKNIVDSVEKEVNVLPIDSQIKFNPNSSPMFYITREKVGYNLNRERLYREIYVALKQGRKSLKVVPEILNPTVTVQDNAALTNKRGGFSTDFSSSQDNRKSNIELALNKINGVCLDKGEEFSFNKIVGRRTAKNGFKEAKIIVGGKYIEGFGGGVCQVSTTIYNAALLSGLDITAVRNHSIASSYVEPSFDAMVNSSSSDLKFKNNTDGKIFIKAYSVSGLARVEFYGLKNPCKIVRYSEVVSRDNAPKDSEFIDTDRKYVQVDTPSGERVRVSYGHGGLKSRGYIKIYDDKGRLLETKLIRQDIYTKSAGMIAIAP